MFGLLELSRQRLRSSLIEKSFDKCNFCKGSGLILSSKSISDQILNVIKEKVISNKNANLLIKCNTALAENLINQKKHEINLIEVNYKSVIKFEFKDEFSLHEPIIEVINQMNEENQKNIKITKKRAVVKKKNKRNQKRNSKLKKTTDKKKVQKKIKEEKDLDNNDNQEKQKSEVLQDNDNMHSEDKTGWWS